MSAAKKNLPQQCENCPSREKGIFCELGDQLLSNLSQHKIVNVFKKGQTLFVEGNPPYGIYCISKGNIKLTKTSESGKDSIVRIASDGDVLGHRSVFTDEHYHATATAIEDTVVCFIDKQYIVKLVRENPSVASNLIAKLSRDLGSCENKVAAFSQKNVRERLAELLLLLKESHGVKDARGRYKLEIKLTREEMAALIGTATETLIRFISEFKADGLIDQNGKELYIINERALVESANLGY